MVGEASISLATACYGTSINGDSGHDGNDVLYLAFPGTDAVPGASGADWKATSYADFESSIQSLGDKLVQRISSTGGSSTGSTSTTGGSTTTPTSTTGSKTTLTTKTTTSKATATCSWAGHCAGE
jgi:hypothetical protein